MLEKQQFFTNCKFTFCCSLLMIFGVICLLLWYRYMFVSLMEWRNMRHFVHCKFADNWMSVIQSKIVIMNVFLG